MSIVASTSLCPVALVARPVACRTTTARPVARLSSKKAVGIALPARSVARRNRSLVVRAEDAAEKSGMSVDTDEILKTLQEKWDATENKSTVFLYGGGVIVGLWATSSIVGAINGIPLVPKLMELVGLGYSSWFVYRYLLFKENRKDLVADVEELKTKIGGDKM